MRSGRDGYYCLFENGRWGRPLPCLLFLLGAAELCPAAALLTASAPGDETRLRPSKGDGAEAGSFCKASSSDVTSTSVIMSMI